MFHHSYPGESRKIQDISSALFFCPFQFKDLKIYFPDQKVHFLCTKSAKTTHPNPHIKILNKLRIQKLKDCLLAEDFVQKSSKTTHPNSSNSNFGKSKNSKKSRFFSRRRFCAQYPPKPDTPFANSNCKKMKFHENF